MFALGHPGRGYGTCRRSVALAALLDDDAEEVRHAATTALVRTRQPSAEPVAVLLVSSGPEGRETAASVFGQIGGEESARVLLAALPRAAGPDIEAIRWAAGRTGPALIPPLLESLSSSKGLGRVRAASLVPDVGWRPDRTEAGAVYNMVRRQWDLCAGIGAPAIPVLTRTMDAGTAEARTSAAYALGQTGLGQATETQIAFLHREGTREGREAAAQALAALCRSERLAESDRPRILGESEHMRAFHRDVPRKYQDEPLGRYKNWGSDCTHADRIAVPHSDERIEVRLPRRPARGGFALREGAWSEGAKSESSQSGSKP